VFFEPFFGTPQGLSFEHAAAMFGLGYQRPSSATELVEAYRTACGRGIPVLIEVTTDREENAELHRKLSSEISEATR